LPARLEFDTSDKSVFTKLNAGALSPAAGRLPLVLKGLPFKVTFAMVRLLDEIYELNKWRQ
jgi:hypothetical protein